jgi:hypothetical protein
MTTNEGEDIPADVQSDSGDDDDDEVNLNSSLFKIKFKLLCE